MEWFDSIQQGTGADQIKKEEFQTEIKDHDIYNLSLYNTVHTVRTNFTRFTLEEGYDAIALFYVTDILSED